jgi:glycosyltransferase involved in cell wall biosynthesis
MADTVSVVVATYGDIGTWAPLAQRAAKSALEQTVECEVLLEHGDTLAQARNIGADRATGDWLVFLDADDELDPFYVEAMLAGSEGLRQPATLGIVNGRADPDPVIIKPRGRTLLDGNHLVIGTMMPKADFLAVGGFRELWAWEDWDLFIRLWLRGLRDEPIPGAVYRVHVKQGSRNDLPGAGATEERRKVLKLYAEIRALYTDEARRKGLL